jgi:O-antigen/teichoic acid export membrane protein
MSKIRRLAGETVLYGLGSILPRFLNFLLIRPHTDKFPPEAYSVITKLFVYTAVVNVLFTFGMETAYFRFANKNELTEQKVFNLTQSVVVSISLFFSLLLVLLAEPAASFLSIPGHANLVLWLAAILFIDAVVAIPFARLRLQKKALQFTIGKLVNIGIIIGLNYYFLYVVFDPARGVGFVVLANLVANAFYLLFFAGMLRKWKPAFDRTLSPDMFRYAYPIMLMGLAGMTNEMFSRATLEWWLPEGFYPGHSADYALGVFGACYKFAILMNLAIQAFRYAAEPFFFSNAADKNSPTLFATVNHYFIIVCCLLFLAVSTNLDIIGFLFLKNKAYWEGLSIVPVLLLGYLFLGVYYNLSAWFKLSDRTYFGTFLTVGGAIITIVANYILIPLYGYMGSSWATLICYFSMAVACYVLGQKYYPIPYRVVAGMGYILSTIVLAWGINQLTFENLWIGTGVRGIIIIIYSGTIFFLERKSLTRAVR